MTVASRYVSRLRANRFFRNSKSVLNRGQTGNAESQWRREPRIVNWLSCKNDGSSDVVREAQEGHGVIRSEDIAQNAVRTKNVDLRGATLPGKPALRENNIKSSLLFRASVAFGAKRRQPFIFHPSHQELIQTWSNERSRYVDQTGKIASPNWTINAGSPQSSRTIAGLGESVQARVSFALAPSSAREDNDTEPLVNSKGRRVPRQLFRFGAFGDNFVRPDALVNPPAASVLGSTVPKTPDASRNVLNGLTNRNSRIYERLLHSPTQPAVSRKKNRLAANSLEGPAGGVKTSSPSGSSRVAGELWLDTQPLRNWFQAYLSAEMWHTSRLTARVPGLFTDI
jgi:hypothetical protein